MRAGWTGEAPGTASASAADRTKFLIPIALAAVVIMYFYGTIPSLDPAYSDWDLHDYLVMSRASPGLAESVRQPFVFRVLAPWVAGLLPFQAEQNFWLLTGFSGYLLAILFSLYLSAGEVGAGAAAIGTVLFLLNKYCFGFPVWNYFQAADLLSLVEMVLMMRFMTEGKWAAFGVVLFLGALTKETTLIMAPVALVFIFESGRLRERVAAVAAVILPACLAAAGLRLFLHPEGGNDPLQAFLLYSGKLLLPETWFRILINSFIPFSLLPLIYYKTTREYFRTRKHALVFLILVIASTLFGYNNERLMAPACIVFYPLVALIVREHFGRSRAMLSAVLVMAAVSSLHHTYARFPLPREMTIAASIIALGVVTLLALHERRGKVSAQG